VKELIKSMGTRTPSLSHIRKEEYVREHLFDELAWLLRAATEWAIQKQMKLQIDGYNVQVYAMDSAFLRARALFEFFVKPTNDNHYGSNEFLRRVLKSDSYTKDWEDPLHAYLMHLQDRSNPRQLTTPDGPRDLNRMPVYFAQEILRLWEEFEGDLVKSGSPEGLKLQKLAREKRKEAIEGAECVVRATVALQHAKERGQTLKPVFVFN
jgi:hypothetical protein